MYHRGSCACAGYGIRSQTEQKNGNGRNSLTVRPLERWSGKEAESAIGTNNLERIAEESSIRILDHRTVSEPDLISCSCERTDHPGFFPTLWRHGAWAP